MSTPAAERTGGLAGPGSTDPYAEIAELSERELALAEAGDLDALADLHERRAALLASLPAQAPDGARQPLERAAAAQHRAAGALAAAHAELAAELHHLGRGRAAARSYAPAPAPASPTLDRPA